MSGDEVAESRDRFLDVAERIRRDGIPKEAVFAGLTHARIQLKNDEWDEYEQQ